MKLLATGAAHIRGSYLNHFNEEIHVTDDYTQPTLVLGGDAIEGTVLGPLPLQIGGRSDGTKDGRLFDYYHSNQLSCLVEIPVGAQFKIRVKDTGSAFSFAVFEIEYSFND